MEDKRTALAILISLLLIMFYTQYVVAPKMRNAPAPRQNEAAATPAAQQLPVQQQQGQAAAASTNNSANNIVAASRPSLEQVKAAPSTVVRTPNIEVTISHLGGRILHYRLLQHKDHLGEDTPLDLVLVGKEGFLPGGVYGSGWSDAPVLYTRSAVPSGTSVQNDIIYVEPASDGAFEFSGTLPDGSPITKRFIFSRDPYRMRIEAQTGGAAGSDVLWLEWVESLSQQKVDDTLNPRAVTVLDQSSKREIVALNDLREASRDAGAVRWIALGEKYFMAALLPPTLGKNAVMGRDGEAYYIRAAGGIGSAAVQLYIGPKDYRILTKSGDDLERGIDLGIFSFLAFPLLAIIRFFHWVFGNYGLAIILLTLLIKTIFLPLTKASLESMRAMQDVAPEIQALRERIKDPNQLNQEVLALYKKRGVNPLGGCLPILIQLPVFLGLYQVLLNSLELRHAPFALWINDLSSPEALQLFGMKIPVMLLLMCASMYYQQITTPTTTADPTQQKIMRLMPIIFGVMFIFFIPMPSGLVLYWLVNNIISITQQMVLRSDKKASAYKATAIASVAIFAVGFVLSLL